MNSDAFPVVFQHDSPEGAPVGEGEWILVADDDELALQTMRLFWGCGDCAAAVKEPAAGLLTLGMYTPWFRAGSLATTGLLRMANNPLGFSAQSEVFGERTGLRLERSLGAGRVGLLLTPLQDTLGLSSVRIYLRQDERFVPRYASGDAESGGAIGEQLRRLGASADWTSEALVPQQATGRADVMVDPVMALWDAAALPPILEEAGGTFTDWQGTVDAVTGSYTVASDGTFTVNINATSGGVTQHMTQTGAINASRNIIIENVTSKSSPRVMWIAGLPKGTVDNIRFVNCTFAGVDSAGPPDGFQGLPGPGGSDGVLPRIAFAHGLPEPRGGQGIVPEALQGDGRGRPF